MNGDNMSCVRVYKMVILNFLCEHKPISLLALNTIKPYIEIDDVIVNSGLILVKDPLQCHCFFRRDEELQISLKLKEDWKNVRNGLSAKTH